MTPDINKCSDLHIAIFLYSRGFSTHKIGEIFGVSANVIIRHFRKSNIQLRNPGRISKKLNFDLIKNDYINDKMPIRKIAHKYGVSSSVIRKILSKNGIKLVGNRGLQSVHIDKDKLYDLYVVQHNSIQQCAAYFHVHSTTIKRKLDEMKIDVHKSDYHDINTRVTNEQLLDLYVNQHKTIRQCAKVFKVSRATLRKKLNEMGIKVRPKGHGIDISTTSQEIIIDLYWNKRFTINAISEYLDISPYLVRRELIKSERGTRSSSDKMRLFYGTESISDDQLIYLHDILGWTCYKIARYFNREESFVSHRFQSINKRARKPIGKYNHRWKGGITAIDDHIRRCNQYIKWRKGRFAKNDYFSQISNGRGTLNCHHIYPFRVILQSSMTKHKPLLDEYKRLAMANDDRFFDLENGLVITDEEHNKIERGKLENAHPWWKIWRAYPDFAIKQNNLDSSDFQLFDNNGQLSPNEYTIQISTAKEIRQIIRYEHYLGTVPGSKLILVAKRGGVIIGIATFGTGTNKHIAKDTWELTRLCIPFYVVKPFACEFLHKCCEYIKNQCPQIKKLIAFADSSVGHNGGVYRMAKWDKAGKTQPSYAYFDPTTFKLRHKASCRRIKGVDKTERELAQERGWIRIPLGHKYRYTLIL